MLDESDLSSKEQGNAFCAQLSEYLNLENLCDSNKKTNGIDWSEMQC